MSLTAGGRRSETTRAVDPESPPPAPRRVGTPRWRDARLLLGLLLVLTATVLGARALAAADRSTTVWAAARDLGTGTVVQADDLRVVAVRLDGLAGRYVAADGPPPAGYVVQRAVASGELVPVAALRAPDQASPGRGVTVPVARYHHPADLARGMRVDVYVTPKPVAGQPPPEPVLVLSDALVAGVDRPAGGLGATGDLVGVSLAVAPTDVARVVAAAQLGTVDLVRVAGP